MKILATVSQAAYKDNWEEGEVDNTYSMWECEEKTFDDLQAAIKWFKNNYASTDPEMKLEAPEPGLVIAPQGTKALDENDPYENFRKPTDQQIADWKAGKIDLWDLETRMRIRYLEDVPCEQLEAALA